MIRIALIGCQREAADYAAVIPRVPGAEFVAVADRDPECRRALAGKTNAPGFESLAQLLNEDAIAFDAVIAQGAGHAEICQAARVGKHLLVDTPIASSTTDADELISVCRDNGVVLMTGQSSRFLPAVQTVKASLAAGQLGEPGLLRIHRWLADDTVAPTTVNLRGSLVRELDLAIWMFGRMPTVIFAIGTRRSGDTGAAEDVDDETLSIQMHVGFGEGMSIIDVARGHAEYFSLTMIGSTGAAYADDHHNTQLLQRGGQASAIKTSTGNLHVLAQLREFVAAIREQRPPAITGTNGLAAIRAADAALRSLTTREACHLVDNEDKTAVER